MQSPCVEANFLEISSEKLLANSKPQFTYSFGVSKYSGTLFELNDKRSAITLKGGA